MSDQTSVHRSTWIWNIGSNGINSSVVSKDQLWPSGYLVNDVGL